MIRAADWVGHAQSTLARSGHRASAPRAAVVAALAELGCSVTAKEISDHLVEDGQDVGLASIYRALELLERLRLAAAWTPARAWHVTSPWTRAAHTTTISSATAAVRWWPSRTWSSSRRSLAWPGAVPYSVDAHDVTLRGACPACTGRD